MKTIISQTERLNRTATMGFGALLVGCLLSGTAGCQTVGDATPSRGWMPKFPKLPFTASSTNSTTSPTTVMPLEAEPAGSEPAKPKSVSNRLVGYVTGKTEDLAQAKLLYQRGDEKFKQAIRQPKDTRTKLFEDAAELFKDAGKAAPGSGLEQDALFMQGESLFFANDLNGSRDAYEKLQKDFPRNRHGDRAAARLFSISKYWIDVAKSGSDSWYSLNLFDSTRPLRDANGHAIKVLDQIRYDDPTGKLADDATMAAAAEHIRNEQYEQADEFLTDLRETFTDSDHLFIAHLLGIRCKLEIYAGPLYSERVLDEADTLVEQTRRRFPNELKEQKFSDMLARAAAEIDYHKAEKLAFRAKYRERKHEYGAARDIYQQVLRDHPTTPQADDAREVLAKIEKLPSTPTQNVAVRTIARAFPSAKQSTPLETVESQPSVPQSPDDSTGKKLLR